MLKPIRFAIFAISLTSPLYLAEASLFGEELVPLMKLVAGQVQEIEELSKGVGVAKDQLGVLRAINDGIDKTVQRLESVEEIARRAQSLDPRAVRRIRDISDLISSLKSLRSDTSELLELQLEVAQTAVAEGGLQAETAYSTGGELVRTGTLLSLEAEKASPGRASQIAASAAAGDLVAQGVQLQTLSHIASMQAVSLELQRSRLEREDNSAQNQHALFLSKLGAKPERHANTRRRR